MIVNTLEYPMRYFLVSRYQREYWFHYGENNQLDNCQFRSWAIIILTMLHCSDSQYDYSNIRLSSGLISLIFYTIQIHCFISFPIKIDFLYSENTCFQIKSSFLNRNMVSSFWNLMHLISHQRELLILLQLRIDKSLHHCSHIQSIHSVLIVLRVCRAVFCTKKFKKMSNDKVIYLKPWS